MCSSEGVGDFPEDFHNSVRLGSGEQSILLRQINISLVTMNIFRRASRKYSPTSACLKTTIAVGSSFFASAVDLAVTPNPWDCKYVSPLCQNLSLVVAFCNRPAFAAFLHTDSLLLRLTLLFLGQNSLAPCHPKKT